MSKIERTDRELRVEVHSIHAVVFADDLAEILDVPEPGSVWPVDLMLRDPIYVNAVRCAPDGRLRWSDWEHLRWEGDACRGPWFRFDWFHEQDGRLQWIADILDFARKPGKQGDDLYLLVDCAEAVAEDRRGPALAKAFGDAVLPLWEDAIGGIDWGDEPYGIWAVGVMYEYLERRMAAHGLSKSDFRSPAN